MCAVASDKVVSARKAHVEIPKVERFRIREGKESAWMPEDSRRPPIMPRVLVYFYMVCTKHMPELLNPPLGPRLCLSHSSAVYPLQ
jgi:hypothetical protein